MGIEGNSLFLDLSKPGQRKHLKPAGISKNRFIPVHKSMNTAKFFYHLVSRSHMKMIGIGKLNPGFNTFKIIGRNSPLYSGSCTNIHKYLRLNITMNRMKYSAFCISFPCYYLKHNNPS